jgi:hypothetical protein
MNPKLTEAQIYDKFADIVAKACVSIGRKSPWTPISWTTWAPSRWI